MGEKMMLICSCKMLENYCYYYYYKTLILRIHIKDGGKISSEQDNRTLNSS